MYVTMYKKYYIMLKTIIFKIRYAVADQFLDTYIQDV